MQLLSGESLQRRLARQGKLPPTEAVRIGRQIALGLSAAHNKASFIATSSPTTFGWRPLMTG